MRVLFDIFSRWPLYASHLPAAEMWSVVHLPFTLTRTARSDRSELGNAENGLRTARRVEVGETMTGVAGSGGLCMGKKEVRPDEKPSVGSSEPSGGENLKEVPDGVTRVSCVGLKSIRPEYTIAVTNSGDARKFIVSGLPSFLARKLRLNEVRIAFVSPFLTPSVRFHCPIHGPQAFARTIPPADSRVFRV